MAPNVTGPAVSLMSLWPGKVMVCAVPVRMPKALSYPPATTLHCAVQLLEEALGSWTLWGAVLLLVELLPTCPKRFLPQQNI